MNKKNFFEGGGNYVAPEIEMIPVIVEGGICLSPGIADSEEDNYGGY
ncbi:MAG: hypothetical protein J6U49_03945 [Alistipes sp.]|nr:hypothetical protein [Alistipes sp.]